MFIIEFIRKTVRSYIGYIAKLLDNTSGGKLSPDMVTLISLIAHIPIAFLIAQGYLLPAGLLLIFFGLFDVLDGELARLQKRAKESGMLLDASTDRIKETLLYSGICYYLSTGSHNSWAFLAVAACGASISVSYVKAKGEAVLASKNKDLTHHQLNRYFSEGIASFDIRTALIIIGLISDQIIITTALIAILAATTFVERLVLINRKLG